MKKTYIITAIIIAVIVFGLFFAGKSAYNGFVEKDQDVQQRWAQVENQYQRRLDLIPNLVETVKGYAEHESSTFQAVTEARAGLSEAYNSARGMSAANATAPEDQEALNDFASSQQDLQRALSIYVNAVREAYPDLKANEQFNDLMAQLEGTENRIATERERYTQAVRSYNISVMKFPNNLWASFFDFNPKPQFEADPEAAKAPKVQF